MRILVAFSRGGAAGCSRPGTDRSVTARRRSVRVESSFHFHLSTFNREFSYWPRIHAKISGATIVASDSMTNFGVEAASLPQVIFSLGTAPE